MIEHTIYFDNPAESQEILGKGNELLSEMEQALPVKLTARDIWLKVVGDEENIQRLDLFVRHIRDARKQGADLDKPGLRYLLKAFAAGNGEAVQRLNDSKIQVNGARKRIFPRTVGQKKYIASIDKHDICFGIGPAGTGKTYLAMAVAVSHLLQHKVRRIILTRPAVEAGEALGFLPGDMYQKVQPYLKPLYDALHDMMDAEVIERNMERGIIEVAPLAYMRGRTLNNSFIVLDEAQNTTPEQMMMFLTRMGFDSKVVVTGDPTQIDLPQNKISGLIEVLHVLRDVQGISMCELTDEDVVRHELVARIIRAYRRANNK